METGQKLKVDEVDGIGTMVTLSAEKQYKLQGLLMKHTCKAPRALRAGDVVVVTGVAPNNSISVLAPCGCGLFLFARTSEAGPGVA